MQTNISLKAHNTFGIDVTARYFTTINSITTLQTVLTNLPSTSIPCFLLGGGSNILFTRDIDALVIHNKILGIEKLDENNDSVFLKVGAGENWHQFVLYCIAHHYAGVENLSLIPGSVGATPIQNIGAYGVEIKDVLHEVHTIEIASKKPHIFSNAACALGYRDSIFKNTLKNQHIITHVALRLHKKPIFHVEYGAIREKLRNTPLSLRAISDTIIAIRREKLPDPAVTPNAGSFFKNPVVSHDVFALLQAKYPHIPHFIQQDHVKIPAGWLIEQCGLKGKRFGDVGIHAQQALVIVNYGKASGLAVKQLSEKIQSVVLEKFNIPLMTEVNIY